MNTNNISYYYVWTLDTHCSVTWSGVMDNLTLKDKTPLFNGTLRTRPATHEEIIDYLAILYYNDIKDLTRVREERSILYMKQYAIIKGINNDNTCLCAIVEVTTMEAARLELMECMGIEARTYTDYVKALQLIGFNVLTNIDDIKTIKTCEFIEVPINMNTDDELF